MEHKLSNTDAGSASEVFFTFLKLGCRCFGGPVAHLGYFQAEIVERRRWCTQVAFAETVALSQSLPGPASSQTGFALGVLRAGWFGGLAAWLGFTLPSAVLMLAFASATSRSFGLLAERVSHSLQLVAVAVVAQAALSMQRSLAPDRSRKLLAFFGLCFTLLAPNAFSAITLVCFGALVGLLFLRAIPPDPASIEIIPISKPAGIASLCLFAVLLAASLVPQLCTNPLYTVFSDFFRSGSLVFGGGHVVLPGLEATVVRSGWVSQPVFLAGYGAAQALPGPLFTIAAYLGASIATPHPILSGIVALISLFAPGILLIAAVLPFWVQFRRNVRLQAALRGVNAVVVGILIASLYSPLWTSTIHVPADFCLAAAAFFLLTVWKLPAWTVVLTIPFLGFVV